MLRESLVSIDLKFVLVLTAEASPVRSVSCVSMYIRSRSAGNWVGFLANRRRLPWIRQTAFLLVLQHLLHTRHAFGAAYLDRLARFSRGATQTNFNRNLGRLNAGDHPGGRLSHVWRRRVQKAVEGVLDLLVWRPGQVDSTAYLPKLFDEERRRNGVAGHVSQI